MVRLVLVALLCCSCAARFNRYENSFADNWQVNYSGVYVYSQYHETIGTVCVADFMGNILAMTGSSRDVSAYYGRANLNISSISKTESMVVAYRHGRALLWIRVPTDSLNLFVVPKANIHQENLTPYR